MKKLVGLIGLVATCAMAVDPAGNVLDDFESYPLGTILGTPGSGWTEIFSQGLGAVTASLDGTQCLEDDAAVGGSYSMQIVLDTPFVALGAGYTGKAHLAARLGPRPIGGVVPGFGVRVRPGQTGWDGVQIGLGDAPGESPLSYIIVKTCSPGHSWYYSVERFEPNRIYDVVLNMDIVAHQYDVYGTVSYRDVTPGFETDWIQCSIVDSGGVPVPGPIPLDSNVSSGPYNATHMNAFSAKESRIDNVAWGTGHLPPPPKGTVIVIE